MVEKHVREEVVPVVWVMGALTLQASLKVKELVENQVEE